MTASEPTALCVGEELVRSAMFVAEKLKKEPTVTPLEAMSMNELLYAVLIEREA